MPQPRANSAPKISADPNDAAGYRRTGGKPRSEAAGSGLGMNLLMAILVVGLAASGWFIATQHQQLSKAQSTLAQADHRLSALEERAQMTDQVVTESGSEVQTKLGRWESEVRKLWDANKRDRQMLSDDETKLKTIDGSIGSLQSIIKDLKSNDSRQDQALTQQTAIAQQLASVDQQVNQLVAQQRQLSDQVNAVRQSVAGLESGLTRRVVANEKAIEAIDAYRLQMNARLVELQTRVDGVTAPKTP